MQNPLSDEQEALRGRKRPDMTDAQLRLWIDACNKMELWVKHAKGRRTWVRARRDAEEELARRVKKQGRINAGAT